MEYYFEFNEEKNLILKETRGVNFEDVIKAVDKNKILDILEHYNKNKFTNQKILVLKINKYVYLAPFVIKNNNTIFLKTVFPSRKYTKLYLKNEN